ncbi:hypothetical protein OIU76_009537 [Salix suchowensis]|nr:senescence-associated family protein [Salix suchowensis]KAJ6330961.1 hypothetical protein OIU76_009537 [Salix suchowensis]
MLGKRTNPMIGRLSELLVPGNRAKFMDANTSPRSPFDYKNHSPKGLKNYCDLGGVGLGIVAALDKPSNTDMGHEFLAKYAICRSNLNRSVPVPVPVNSGKNCEIFSCDFEEMDMGSLEDYTFVTIHAPDQSFTRVYHDGGEHGKRGHDRRCESTGCTSVLKKFPAGAVEDVSLYPTSDFLSSCHLCRKKLHGRDIYMYRGEKAFCSVECRSSQIMTDERREQCLSEVARSAEAASSPFKTSPIFSAGILAI